MREGSVGSRGHGVTIPASRWPGRGQAGSCVPARASAVHCFPSAFWREEEDNWQGRWLGWAGFSSRPHW